MAEKSDASGGKPVPKRAVLRMTEEDFVRLRVLLANNRVTWQQALTEALNGWLSQKGEKDLENLP
jgi:hypothetical protein